MRAIEGIKGILWIFSCLKFSSFIIDVLFGPKYAFELGGDLLSRKWEVVEIWRFLFLINVSPKGNLFSGKF